MALPRAIDIRASMLRLVPQCFAFTSNLLCILLQSYSFNAIGASLSESHMYE